MFPFRFSYREWKNQSKHYFFYRNWLCHPSYTNQNYGNSPATFFKPCPYCFLVNDFYFRGPCPWFFSHIKWWLFTLHQVWAEGRDTRQHRLSVVNGEKIRIEKVRKYVLGTSFFTILGLGVFEILFHWFDFALNCLNFAMLYINKMVTELLPVGRLCAALHFQVRRGGIGAQCGLVFAYNSPSDKFHAEEHFKRFEKYDKWKLQELRQFVKSR